VAVVVLVSPAAACTGTKIRESMSWTDFLRQLPLSAMKKIPDS
jgi:hypothetical protein